LQKSINSDSLRTGAVKALFLRASSSRFLSWARLKRAAAARQKRRADAATVAMSTRVRPPREYGVRVASKVGTLVGTGVGVWGMGVGPRVLAAAWRLVTVTPGTARLRAAAKLGAWSLVCTASKRASEELYRACWGEVRTTYAAVHR